MNCIHHPEAPVAAYCQNCGKPLCTQCVRPVQGMIFCEPCLAAKLSGASPYNPQYGTRYNVNVGTPGSSFQYSESGPLPNGAILGQGANPVLAALFGLIPGVGAMYNGQFIKGLVHVLVFVVLVSLSHANGVFGIFIGTWVLYQVFDGYQTAKARRDGLPLPDPFGLNDLASRIGSNSPGIPGMPGMPPSPMAGGSVPPGASGFTQATGPEGDPGTGQEGGPGAGWGTGYAAQGYGPQTGAAPPYTEYAYTPVPPGGYTPVPPGSGIPPSAMPPPMPPPMPPFMPRRSEPVGAIILIALGLLFLFSTTGFLSGRWMGHGWPLILIGVGAWLVIKRLNEGKNS